MKGNLYAVVIRIETIKKRFIDGGAMSCTDIASQFDISPKTAQRDIDFLRTFYGLSIDYDAQARVLYLSAPPPKYPPALESETVNEIRGRYPKNRKKRSPETKKEIIHRQSLSEFITIGEDLAKRNNQ